MFCIRKIPNISQVPSAYFLTDTFLMLDELLSFKLFRDQNGPRHIQAGQEGMRAKRCLGALRYLWRNARDAAHHPDVAAMKRLLEDSPLQSARWREEPEPEDPSESQEEEPPVESPDDEMPPLEDCDMGEGEEQEESDLETCVESGDDLESNHDDEENLHAVKDPHPEPAPEVEVHSDSDDGSILSATTLALGEVPREPDSQRDGAWIGDFYKANGRDGCDPKLNLIPKRKRSRECVDTFLREILHSLHDEGRLDEFLGDDSTNEIFSWLF